MTELILVASILATPVLPVPVSSPQPAQITPPVVAPTPKPTYSPPPPPPTESWSEKMWRRYKEAK